MTLHDLRKSRLGREITWITLGQGLAAIGSVAGIRLLTGALKPAVYGEVALAVSCTSLVQQVALGPLASASLRFFAPAAEEGEVQVFFSAVSILLIRTLQVCSLLTLTVCTGLLLTGQRAWLPLLAAGIAYSAISGCNAVLDSVQNAARQRLVVAWHQALGQWIRFSAAIALIKCVAATSVVTIAGYTKAAAVVLASQVVLFRRGFLASIPTAATHLDPRTARTVGRMWTYGWPFASWGLFTWAQTASDRWALQMFRPTYEVGLYQALYQIGYYPISLLTGLLVQLIAPILFESAGRGTNAVRLAAARRLNRRLTASALCLTAIVAAIAALFHGQIFSLLAAREYAGASSQLPWITLSGGFFAAGQIAVLERLSHTNTQALIAPKIATALAGVALNMIAARYWGLGGVVRAGAFTSLAYLTWISLLNRNAGADEGRIEPVEAGSLLTTG